MKIAHAFFAFAYRVGVRNLPDGLSAKAFVRQQLDRIGLGRDLTEFAWGGKPVRLPPSSLATQVIAATANVLDLSAMQPVESAP